MVRSMMSRGRTAAAGAVLACGVVLGGCGGGTAQGPSSSATTGGAGAVTPAAKQAMTKTASLLGKEEREVGQQSGPTSTWPAAGQSPCAHPKKTAGGQLTVGFSYSSRANPWQVQNAAGAVWYLKHNPSVKQVLATNAEEDPSKQIADIQSLIAHGVDLLVVDPATTAVSPAVRQACERGIPTIVYDRFVTNGTPFTASMFANEIQDGYNGGQAIVKALHGAGNVVIIPGIAGSGVTEDRVKGARMAMAKASGVKVLGLAYSDWDPQKGRSIMEQFLTKYPKIDGVWSDSGVQAVGILQAIQAAHRLNDVKIVVGGQENGYLKMWKQLGITGFGSTISTDVGVLASQLGIDIVSGKYTPHGNVPAPLVVIDQSHLSDVVRPDLPDSYWVTQVLPKSVIDAMFKSQ